MSRHGTYKGRNDDAQEKEKDAEAGEGLFRRQVEAVPHREAGGYEVRPVCVYRPQAEKARFPPSVDHPYLRGCEDQRHELFHLHERSEEGRHHPQPQDAR